MRFALPSRLSAAFVCLSICFWVENGMAAEPPEPASATAADSEETFAIASPEVGGGFEILEATLDPGGVMQGGVFRLIAAAGQPDAGPAAGGGFLLIGGFSFGSVEPPLFGDGFETGDCQRWSTGTGC